MELRTKKTIALDVYRITHEEIEERKYVLLQEKMHGVTKNMFTEHGLNRLYWEDHYRPDASITVSVTEEDVIHAILGDSISLDEVLDIDIERHNKEGAFGDTLDYVSVTCSYKT